MPIRESKRIISGQQARDGILAGARQTYEAVARTFGPMSGNVGIQKLWGLGRITHDGVTVAREIMLPDDIENFGATHLAEASKKTNETAGDGTSATVIVGYHILELGHRAVASGRNDMMIKRGIKRAALDAKEYIGTLSRNANDEPTGKKASILQQVATISASGDKALGTLIANVVTKVGRAVTIEEYQGLNVEEEIVEGLYIERGPSAPQLPRAMETVDETNPVKVLVVSGMIKKALQLHPLCMAMKKAGRTKLVIVGNITGEALAYCVNQNMNDAVDFDIAVVDSPIYGVQRHEFLQDVATATGGQVVSGAAGELKMIVLGQIDRMSADAKSTTLFDGHGDKEQIANRIDELKLAIGTESNEVIRKHMESRLAKLKGRIGLIRVGGATEIDMKETKDRVDDAVHAAQAAQEFGVVAGGGTTLVEAATVLQLRLKNQVVHYNHIDELEGYRIVAEALNAPFVRLMHNSGQSAEYNLRMVQKKGYGYGYDAEAYSDDPIDLWKAGIVDPLQVIQMEIENGCSVAAELITTDAVIAHVNLEKVESIEDQDSE